MVHNVSHTDLVLGLDAKDCTKSYVRPRFSTFDALSNLVLTHLDPKDKDDGDDGADQIVSFPRHVRSMSDPRYSICLECHANDHDSNSGSRGVDGGDKNSSHHPDHTTSFPMTPTGLKLSRPASLATTTIQDIRMREGEEETIVSAFAAGAAAATGQISHVFFPLLATLLPVWRHVVETREYKREVKRVLILVTGVGTPRNRHHSLTGNSTEKCADLMAAFLRRVDPKLVVVQIHSRTNVFRYDENLTFVETELMPIIDSYRDAHATGTPYPDERAAADGSPARLLPWVFDDGDAWRKSLHVIVSSADGSPARIHAIQASLRPYRPTYFHFWQLKTFWHESKIVEDDVEVHSFETMETLPPKDADRIDDAQLQLVVREMKSFHQEIRSILGTNDNDLHRFWLRKTHKPVLAVLLVQMEGDTEPRLFRGTNMEVSMPTGSLCAERNAIGTALSTHPDLKRHDLKMIAVLAVPPEDNQAEGIPRNFSSASFVEETDVDRRMVCSRKPSISSEGDQSYEDWTAASPNDVDGTPVRRIQLLSKHKNRPKRTVVIQSSKDMNPLPPCGACNEWLKKIAETNPYFKIITFVRCITTRDKTTNLTHFV
jgi:cytidine deaminase